jgi:hypothetical protein
MSETMVTMPPEVVLMRASSTVFVKASSLVNLDFGGILPLARVASASAGTRCQWFDAAGLGFGKAREEAKITREWSAENEIKNW